PEERSPYPSSRGSLSLPVIPRSAATRDLLQPVRGGTAFAAPVLGHPLGGVRVKGALMPDKETLERAEEDKREGKSPSTQAGEFVREEIEHVREGKHGARSTKQAIAIGLSKARRAGVKLPPPEKGTTSKKTRRQAKRELKRSSKTRPKKPSRMRSRADKSSLQKESSSAASHSTLSRQDHAADRKHTHDN